MTDPAANALCERSIQPAFRAKFGELERGATESMCEEKPRKNGPWGHHRPAFHGVTVLATLERVCWRDSDDYKISENRPTPASRHQQAICEISNVQVKQ